MIFLYRRHQRSRNVSQSFMHKGARIFLIAAVAVLACSITVFAWFQANVTNTGNSITTTGYELTVAVKNNNGDVAVTDNKCNLSANTSYTITLTAGDDGASTGYCEIATGENKWYTGQIDKGNTFTFTFVPKTTGEYTFTAMWGTYAETPNVENNGTLALGTANSNSNQLTAPAAPEVPEPATDPEEEPTTEEPEKDNISTLESSSEETTSSTDTTSGVSGTEENSTVSGTSEVSGTETDTDTATAPVTEDSPATEGSSVNEGETE